ncbi:hypothetical protein [Aeoliella sp. SH292]|uniref:hypothetical protein n=1 Tax=Aeoliella sp. SH292 TaxID=3454464 RepID=UPI003F95A93F
MKLFAATLIPVLLIAAFLMWPRNNRRLVEYEGYYFIKQQGDWEVNFHRKSPLWLRLPDNTEIYVPDITQGLANDILRTAEERNAEGVNNKSDDILGNRDRFFYFGDLGLKLTFDKTGELSYGRASGRMKWEGERLVQIPGGIQVGINREGPFHDLIGTKLGDLEEVFGKPTAIRNYSPPRGP